ncbi:MAG: hypothetical protein ACW96U_10565 [Candidatus Heimdallarchaeaceae archaeon]
MNYFNRFLKIGKEIVLISGLAVADFFFNMIIFISMGFLFIITIAFWLIALALMLGGG